MHWTSQDRAISVSADGRLRQWDAHSGQPLPFAPSSSIAEYQHPIGITSLSVREVAGGTKALWNSMEGYTCLWDLEAGEAVGAFESYVRGKEAEAGFPGAYII